MTTTSMKIILSTAAADPRWGKTAILTSNDSGLTIHLTGNDVLATIQRAARKIDGQGIRHVTLSGDWDLEKSWAFWQGYRGPKGERKVEWASLGEADSAELERRLKIIDWVRDTINLPAEDLSPSQLTQRAVDLLCEVGGESISYRITKGDDLRNQGYLGLHTVGRGSSRRPALLTLDYNPTADENAPVFACLVGKGITFDTGGYSLKPSGSMDSMKSDMGGGSNPDRCTGTGRQSWPEKTRQAVPVLRRQHGQRERIPSGRHHPLS